MSQVAQLRTPARAALAAPRFSTVRAAAFRLNTVPAAVRRPVPGTSETHLGLLALRFRSPVRVDCGQGPRHHLRAAGHGRREGTRAAHRQRCMGGLAAESRGWRSFQPGTTRRSPALPRRHPQVTAESKFVDLGADSLDTVRREGAASRWMARVCNAAGAAPVPRLGTASAAYRTRPARLAAYTATSARADGRWPGLRLLRLQETLLTTAPALFLPRLRS